MNIMFLQNFDIFNIAVFMTSQSFNIQVTILLTGDDITRFDGKYQKVVPILGNTHGRVN